MDKKLVFVENERPVTDSLTVSEVFGKNHADVLRDVRNILKEIDTEWGISNFAETPYVHPQNGQIYKKYILTEDGFAILVMGYTGKDAMRFKVDYIKEFRRMKEELLQIKTAGLYRKPKDLRDALVIMIDQLDKIEKLEADKAILQQCLADSEPKVTYYDQILQSTDTVLITQIAKDYGLSGRKLNAILHDAGVQYKVNEQWVLYAKHQGMGYTKSRTVSFTRTDGSKDAKLHTEWTQKGRLFIHEIMSNRGIIPCMDRETTEQNSANNLVKFPG